MKYDKLRSMLPFAALGLLFIFFISGCSNYEDVSACVDGKTFGFWHGIWHGIIAPVDLIAMIWLEDVTVFAPNNNGVWYAFGFVLGSGGWGFFGGKGVSGGRKRGRR